MLDFLVLGQVPGTHFQITFNGVLFIIGCLLVAVEVHIIYPYAVASVQNTKMPKKFVKLLHRA